MKIQASPVLVLVGVVSVAASSALATMVLRTCTGSSTCTGTVTCDSLLAWCCCKPAAGGAWTCVCSLDASCLNVGSRPPGFSNCMEPN